MPLVSRLRPGEEVVTGEDFVAERMVTLPEPDSDRQLSRESLHRALPQNPREAGNGEGRSGH